MPVRKAIHEKGKKMENQKDPKAAEDGQAGESGPSGETATADSGNPAEGYIPPSNGKPAAEPAEKKPLDPKTKRILAIVIGVVIAAAAIYGIAYAVTGGFHQHVWEDATCTAPKTCSKCGATEGEALGHDWSGTDKPATCVKGSYTDYLCSRCNDVYEEETGTPALGHEPGDWTYDTNLKKEVRKCTRCSAIVEQRDATRETIAAALANWKVTLDSCYKRESNSQYKALYNDQICVAVTNRSDKAVRSVEVDVCAWDDSGNPVTIGYITSGDIYALNCSDMNIQPGETWDCEERNIGFNLSANKTGNISKVEGVVSKVVYLDGTTENNPYADAWKSLYKGKTN